MTFAAWSHAPALGTDPRPGTRPLSETAFGTLGIELLHAATDLVVLRMPVTSAVHQPAGLLHGGVSAVLAESAASIGAGLAAGPEHRAFGVEINASHLRSARDGLVITCARPIRIGRTMHVWQADISDEHDELLCTARCTLQIVSAAPRQH